MKIYYFLVLANLFAAPLHAANCQTVYEECLRKKDALACDAEKHLCEHPESATEKEDDEA